MKIASRNIPKVLKFLFSVLFVLLRQVQNAHNIMQSNKDHCVMMLKEFQDKDFGHVLKRPVFCPELWLKNEELKY